MIRQMKGNPMRFVALILALGLAACTDPSPPTQPSPTPVEDPKPACPPELQCHEP
jgi:hypothetical protein